MLSVFVEKLQSSEAYRIWVAKENINTSVPIEADTVESQQRDK
jgi:hypothetical protein